ncbi:MAG: helix-turn-helix domain-containing protein, partial [Candidatus Woesearchaeota archaeon]
MKQGLLEETSVFLLREGYTIKSLRQACFDLVARKDERVLLIKILEDANSLTKDSCNEMKKVSSYLNATPIIVAEKAGENLLDNVVYSRFGTYCVNFNTFKASVQNNFPFVYSDHSGLSALLQGSKLKDIREKEGFSISSLARRIGVSKRMVLKYESEKANVGIGRAL